MGVIYCAKNLINGKRYIGQTVGTLEKRRREHEFSSTPKGLKIYGKGHFAAILQKYGLNSFEWSIIFDDVVEEDLDELEIDSIAVYKTLVPNGYNLKEGGANGRPSEEVREKLRTALKNRRESGERVGVKQHSEETKKKLRGPRSEQFKERCGQRPKHSEETKEKIRQSLKGRPGRTYTEEQKEKHSEILKEFNDQRKAEGEKRVYSEEHREKLRQSLKRRRESGEVFRTILNQERN